MNTLVAMMPHSYTVNDNIPSTSLAEALLTLAEPGLYPGRATCRSNFVLTYSEDGIMVNESTLIPWYVWDEISRRVTAGREAL